MRRESLGKAAGFLRLFTLCLGLLGTAPAQSAEEDKDQITKGQYLFSVAGGCACHTVPKGIPHTGGRVFPIPMGQVHSTNITSDKATGLGG